MAPTTRQRNLESAKRAPVDASVSRIRRPLLAWFRRHRRDLPWRRDPTPYRVWVSELMLQQTRVETVIPYFERFLRRFPGIEALASASEDEVLEAWSGLGYYRRARSLHAGAKKILAEHGGDFPSAEAEVLALPGVGRYTAGAIRSIAFGARAPILDGNVMRVLSRLFGLEEDVSSAPAQRALWELAAEMVERGKPGDVNQAMMELGALVCTPQSPRCDDSCPLRSSCWAYAHGATARVPKLPEKRATVELRRAVLLVRSGQNLLLRQRTPSELSPGLWDLPGAFTAADGDTSCTACEVLATLPFDVEIGEVVGTLRHAVTYRRITLEVVEAFLRSDGSGPSSGTARDASGAQLVFHGGEGLLDRALTSPARRVLTRYGKRACGQSTLPFEASSS